MQQGCACFTGHRELPAAELPALRRALARTLDAAWQRGIRRFYNGGALGFDLLAAEEVLALSRRRPGVSLEMAIPHAHQTGGWSVCQRQRYERICFQAQTCTTLSPLYYQGCYHVRNRYMVDRSSLCLCYFRQPKGGTASTVAYALRQGLTVVNLAFEASWQSYVRGTEKDG